MHCILIHPYILSQTYRTAIYLEYRIIRSLNTIFMYFQTVSYFVHDVLSGAEHIQFIATHENS